MPSAFAAGESSPHLQRSVPHLQRSVPSGQTGCRHSAGVRAALTRSGRFPSSHRIVPSEPGNRVARTPFRHLMGASRCIRSGRSWTEYALAGDTGTRPPAIPGSIDGASIGDEPHPGKPVVLRTRRPSRRSQIQARVSQAPLDMPKGTAGPRAPCLESLSHRRVRSTRNAAAAPPHPYFVSQGFRPQNWAFQGILLTSPPLYPRHTPAELGIWGR